MANIVDVKILAELHRLLGGDAPISEIGISFNEVESLQSYIHSQYHVDISSEAFLAAAILLGTTLDGEKLMKTVQEATENVEMGSKVHMTKLRNI